jgi:hypothetical protein
MAEKLATCQRCLERICQTWPSFIERRNQWLAQQERYGTAAERVAENILVDLFTIVLDWEISDLNNQVGYADLLLSRLGIKYLIVEVKRPGALAWHRRAVEAALEQARRYADEQKVRCIAVSDGTMLYAAEIEHGGLKDRAFVDLTSTQPQEMLWRLSVHGIYRPSEESGDASLRLLPDHTPEQNSQISCAGEDLLHPKYKLPARCFAYVHNAADPKTWKLPYLLADGRPDLKRLPKAIQAIISNYRGTKVSGIPDTDVADVLLRLGRAAANAGKMPYQSGETAPAYQQLVMVLDQLGRLDEVKSSAANFEVP